ncbi:MAG: protein kinase domain-containing protein [Pseudomonadota bacterium]
MSEPSTPNDAPPLPRVDGYQLIREVGRGGMSTVYLGRQLALGREVALKVMSPRALGDEISRRRFENEVRTIARLEHPHIVRIHELGRTRDGLPYYSMPHLARGHLGGRDFTNDEKGAVEMAAALLSALEYAHSRGVVHRDVKPENVLFDDAGRPLLADFGIALRRGFGPRVTAAGLAVGSTAYMAPEQARGEKVDGRADLYSLGVVLWEMLAGRLPYEAQDALSMALMHARDPIPRLPAHLRHWQRFMNRALAKHADQRFQNAAEMRQAMLAVRPAPWQPALGRARALAASRNGRRGLAAAAVAAALVLGFVLWPRGLGDGFFRASAPPPPALPEPAPAPVEQAVTAPPPQDASALALEKARAQMGRGELTSPEGDNAVTSVLAAWHADPAAPGVPEALDALARAMGERIFADVRAGEDARARALFRRADELARATAQVDSPAQKALREGARKAAVDRAEDEAKKGRRDAARRAIALARDFGLPRADASKLERRIATAAEVEVRGGEVAVSGARVAARPVSRAEYERFVEATGRKASICRERASVLRVLAPRDWRNPGFPQSAGDPVVCVSVQDAEAYAHWLGAREGVRYRLPTAAESATVTPQMPSRSVALWLRDCGPVNCQQRQVTAGSWRAQGARRPLPAGRGYDDVGFRLLREP